MRAKQLGPYKIQELLGRGGMGSVYSAVNLETGQRAAVKVLAAMHSEDENFLVRFSGEVETLKKLKHQNIVELYGYGEEDGFHFFGMELVEGLTLQAHLNNRRIFSWREVVDIGLQMCQALKHAHDRGVIHRDLKPANLLLHENGTVKLSDFGIAKLFGASDLTGEGGVIGTADYMAPEQAEGHPATVRTDLYSLGGVFYSLLTGAPPFFGQSVAEIVHKLRFELPVDVRRRSPYTPVELGRVVNDLLSKDPLQRPPTALAVRSRLQAALHLGRQAEEESPVEKGRPSDGGAGTPRESDGTGAGDPDREHTQTDSPGHTHTSSKDPQTEFESIHPQRSDPKSESLTNRQTKEATSFGSFSSSVTRTGRVEEPGPSSDTYVSQYDLREDFSHQQLPESERIDEPDDPPGQPSVDPQRKPAELAEPEVPEPPAPRRFVTVDAVDEVEESSERTAVILWSLVSAVVVVGLGAMIWWLTRPLSEQQLFARLQAAAETSSVKLEGEKDQLQEYLRRFPNAENAEQVRQFQQQLELADQRRELQWALRRGAGETLEPAESLYLEATRMAEANQDLDSAVRHLKGLIDMYAGDSKLSKRTRGCLQLAQQKLLELEAQLDKRRASHLVVIKSRVAAARAAAENDPMQAAGICRGLIQLYQDKSWAKTQVAEARELLNDISSKK